MLYMTREFNITTKKMFFWKVLKPKKSQAFTCSDVKVQYIRAGHLSSFHSKQLQTLMLTAANTASCR